MPAERRERFVVRAYRPGDEDAILDLFARSFHQPRTEEEWRWKYQQNPEGRERISVTFEQERLVAHYAGYPVPFVADGATIEANQIGDTMTDLSIRHIGRGPTSVLGRTALHFYETFCEGRVAFNYGFNVANIQKFSLRFLRSDRVEPVTYRVRDLRSDPFRPIGRLERWARGVSLRIARRTSGEWDELFRRVAPSYGFLVRRDARYVAWRYLAAPAAVYVVIELRKWRSLVGWMVLRLKEGRLVIGDLLLDADHADILEASLRHVTHAFPATHLELWCPPRPAWLDRLLLDLGLETRPEPQDLSLMCVPFVERGATELMRTSLYYTMGDGDLF